MTKQKKQKERGTTATFSVRVPIRLKQRLDQVFNDSDFYKHQILEQMLNTYLNSGTKRSPLLEKIGCHIEAIVEEARKDVDNTLKKENTQLRQKLRDIEKVMRSRK